MPDPNAKQPTFKDLFRAGPDHPDAELLKEKPELHGLASLYPEGLPAYFKSLEFTDAVAELSQAGAK